VDFSIWLSNRKHFPRLRGERDETVTKEQVALLARLTTILKFIVGETGSERLKAVIRPRLPDALRVTQAELLSALGVTDKSALPGKLRHAVVVIARFHTGRDCFRTIEHAVARLHSELEDRFAREPLEKRVMRLGGNPKEGLPLSELRVRAAELRATRVDEALELKAALDVLINELDEKPLDFLSIREMLDEELVDCISRLRFSVDRAENEIVRTNRSRSHAREQERLRRFNHERRGRHSRDTFHAWCARNFGRTDALREDRLRRALAFASLKEESKVA